jgi:thioredoxin reductase
MTDAPSPLPVAVIGAGPVGLAAAAHLLARGERPVVFEAGAEAGASIRAWGHVRLFSPWKHLIDEPSAQLLEASGWTPPAPDSLPLGRELLDEYLTPLASALEASARRIEPLDGVPLIRLETRVLGVQRAGFDRMKTPGREQAPFALRLKTRRGLERAFARAVIDASGTWNTPNPLGADGAPVGGEHEAAAHIAYGIPDVLGADRDRYAGRRTLVVGSGHSAFNVLLDLAALVEQGGGRIVWAMRRESADSVYGGGSADQLPARGALGQRLRRLVALGFVTVETAFHASGVVRGSSGVFVHDDGDRVIGPVDRIVVAAGFRPDHSIASELRLALDATTESPIALAPLIDPNLHSCGTVPPHGAAELSHPERDVYIAGMKSYGRAPTFLLLTGYEQIRSIVCALSGDAAGAREVRLTLPETGVCVTDLVPAAGAAADSCCAPSCCSAPAPERAIRPDALISRRP